MKKKRKLSPHVQSPQQARKDTVSYVCSKCGVKEEIPIDVLEYFDEINPEQLLLGPHEFRCEKCATGIMKPEKEPEIIIKGYGLHEGIEKKLGF